MNRNAGVVLGVVRSLEDPDNQGRVQVHFPWMDDEVETTWASIAMPMAGRERGMFFMPEVDDECLVAFDRGCFDHPYVVGFLWNGMDAPPNADIDIRVRRFQSVTGHRLEFDDNKDNEKILLQTQGGHQILLDDTTDVELVKITTNGNHEILLDDTEGSEVVKITTNGGHTVELNDSGDARIYMEDQGGNTLEMNSSGISLTAGTGKDVNITGTNVTVSATAKLDLSATGQLSATGNPVHLNP